MVTRSGLCKYNKQINCTKHVGCEKCTWNPQYFEELKRKGREERAAQAKAEQEAKSEQAEKEQ